MILDFSIDNRIVLTTEFDCALQELDILFNTTNCEVLGNPEYGCNFEQFLWTMTPTTSALQEYIVEKISNTYFLKKFNPTVEVTTEMGVERDIYYVTIRLDIPENNEEMKAKATKVFMLQ